MTAPYQVNNNAINPTPPLAPNDFPPLRKDPNTPDDQDGLRVQMVHGLWQQQNAALRLRDRQVEENIRMLSGQQWSVWNPWLGRWIDVTQWMTDDERRWRQRPVFNKLLPWFILTHARLTENPPIVTFVPGPDREDAELAELYDIIFKSLWRDTGMVDVVDRLMSWLIPGGRAYLMTRVDPSKGAKIPWIGEAQVPMLDQYGNPMQDPNSGSPMLSPPQPNIPFDKQGNPLAHMQMLEGGDSVLQITGDPNEENEGGITVDVLSPLEVRGQWGPQPWHEKEWHAVKSFLTPDQVFDMWGVRCQPDVTESYADGAGEMHRLLFGSGYFGAAGQMVGSETSTSRTAIEGYCEVITFFRRPCDWGGMQETAQSAGGRMLVTTKTTCLYDGPRPIRWKYTSPIRAFDFVRVPGRPHGTSPQEIMNPVQRAYNRRWAQIMEHANLCTNPKGIVDFGSGLQRGQVDNAPGTHYVVNRRPGVPALEYVAPPSLGEDAYKTHQLLAKELVDMGNLQGTQGEMPSMDASGELVKELRFNSDRFLGPTVRRAVEEFGRLAEDWMVTVPVIWQQGKVLHWAGDDNVARTMTVMPEMMAGRTVDVVPDAESMLPEGRGERQARVYKMYTDGMFGQPGSPEAISRFFDLANFPNMTRATKPGGVDRATADQENGKLMQGVPAQQIPVFQWYDHMVHIMAHERVMKSPEFLKLDPQIQSQFVMHWQMHQQAIAPPPMPMPGPGGPGGPPGQGGPAAGPPTKKGTPIAGESAQPPGVTPGHQPASVPPGQYPTALPESMPVVQNQ